MPPTCLISCVVTLAYARHSFVAADSMHSVPPVYSVVNSQFEPVSDSELDAAGAGAIGAGVT